MGCPVRAVALLAAAALLLLPPPARPAVPRPRVSANFECRANADSTQTRPRCRRGDSTGPPLTPPALALSTARLCQLSLPCQPCLRVRLAVPAAGIHGLQLDFLELGSNRAGWLQVWRRHRAPGDVPWQVQFDCFPAESGRRVLVTLRTIPDRGLAISRSHMVAVELQGPIFTHTWLPEARAIEVAVPEGPALVVRLCHQLALECEELPQPFHRQFLVPGGHHVSLPYEFLVPCLCVEASYPHHDSLRSKRCPFRERPDAYGPDLWSSVHFHDYSSKDQMAMVLSASCPLHPRATLCWREAAAEAAPCHDVPNSTASEEDQTYTLDSVDVHPLLCFRFSYGNSSHVECPHRTDAAWNVSLSARGLQLRLCLTSHVPASFSAALCQRRGGRCEPEAPVYTVTRPESSAPGELALLLPVQVLGSCVLVWRSDVRFARKQLLCPDVSHRHFGLLGLALALGLVVTVLLLNCRSTWRMPNGEAARGRPVLLLYSPDSEEHLALVCALAELLRVGLGCEVRLDLWEAGGVGRAGALPWLYAQRSHVGRERGTVLLLWSRGSSRLFRLWRGGEGGGQPRDAHDVFGAAMACLQGELGAAGRGRGWVLVYFSRLCSPRDVPRPLRPLPTYRLPQELPGLLGALRGGPPPSCRHLRGRAKGLLLRLLEAEAGKGAAGGGSPLQPAGRAPAAPQPRARLGQTAPRRSTRLREPGLRDPCGAERGRPHPGAVPGARERSRKRESAAVAAAGPVGWERGRGAGAVGRPGPTGRAPGLLLLLLLAAGGRGAPRDAVICSQGLACRLLDADVLCGTEPAAPGPGPALLGLRLEPALRCAGPGDCSPCLRARLRLGLEPEDGAGDAGTAASPRRDVAALLLLSAHGFASSRCVAVEVRASSALPGRRLGSVRFRCFEAPLGSELHVAAYSSARGRRRLSQRQRLPDCSWPAARAAIPQCQVPRLRVSPGLTAVLVEVQVATMELNYTLRLYHNHSHGAGGSGRAVTASGPMNYSVPLEEVLPCLCLQVWPEIQDPLRATLCPFSHDAAAWERLWVQTQLVLHDVGQTFTCSISAPCDLPAELVPCWSPAPAAPCQALPGLQQLVTGQGPQEFQALQPHPNLCVQVRSSGRVRLTQCLRDREHPGVLPGHGDDILLMEPGGNASLCALQRDNCTPLASFTAMEAGRPGLLEQQLQEDVASGQCMQLWRPENGGGVTLWACPMHKYMRARWALAWLGVLVCAACILLLLLLKKEDVKVWLKSLRAGCGSKAPLRGRRALLLHAAEPVAERAACALAAALRPVGMAVVAAPGGGSGVAAWGPLPWLHALHQKALRGGDTIVLLLSPAAEAAARRWEDATGGVSRAGDASSGPSPLHDPGNEVEPCEAFAAALSCAIPVLSAGAGRYVVARLEPTVTSVPQVLRGAPAFALPSEAVGFLQALAGRRGCRLEPHAAAVAERLRKALAE